MEDNITADMDNNITATFPFEFTDDDSPSIWYFMLLNLFALMQLFFSLFCLLIVIYLSMRLKKRAWDSPAKRFGNILNVLIGLTYLAVAIYNVCIVPRITNPIIWFFTLFFASIYLSHLFFLYFIAMCLSLLLQVVSPFLHKQLKQCTRKSHCAIFTEVVCHVLLSVLFLVLTTLLLYSIYILINYDYYLFNEIYIELLSMVPSISFVLFFSSFLIFTFLVFLMKIRTHNIALSIICMIVKIAFILIIYISINIASIIVTYLLILDYNNNNYYFWLLILYFNAEMVTYFILSILVVSLNHPTWCCKCCRRSPGRAPLFPVNNTEGQQTNPLSVWDHRNVPSCTVTNLPYEMTDCRSDYEQYV